MFTALLKSSGLTVAILLASGSGVAQVVPTRRVPIAVPTSSGVAAETQDTASQAPPRTILFVGNSFTQGAHSAAKRFRSDTVTDLNKAGYGGVPAMFKAFTQQVGLDYVVSLETQGGKTLGFHYDERRNLIDRPWDVVILQELSTLDRLKPGDVTGYLHYAQLLTTMFRQANPKADVRLMATWSRADLTLKTPSPWFGKPVTTMALDMRSAADQVISATPGISSVIPVGEAWNLAMSEHIADPDPYDGTSFGQIDLWTYDHYHASIYGYYLEALVVFGQVTGVNPRSLGAAETVADDLGIAPPTAVALQIIAQKQLRIDAAR